jgi:hypothetical protein
VPHIEYVREAGSEGIELVMWLIARGAMADIHGGRSPGSRTASSRAGEQHRGRPPDPGKPSMTITSPSPAPAPSASSTSTPSS